jgi:hypothetical protein
MGNDCCGGHAERRGSGIYTDEYYINKIRADIRSDALLRVVAKSGSDGVLVMEEINAINRAGNQVIANNHELRAEIYDLKSEIGRLNEIVRLVSEAKNMDEVQTALHFPYKNRFNPLP